MKGRSFGRSPRREREDLYKTMQARKRRVQKLNQKEEKKILDDCHVEQDRAAHSLHLAATGRSGGGSSRSLLLDAGAERIQEGEGATGTGHAVALPRAVALHLTHPLPCTEAELELERVGLDLGRHLRQEEERRSQEAPTWLGRHLQLGAQRMGLQGDGIRLALGILELLEQGAAAQGTWSQVPPLTPNLGSEGVDLVLHRQLLLTQGWGGVWREGMPLPAAPRAILLAPIPRPPGQQQHACTSALVATRLGGGGSHCEFLTFGHGDRAYRSLLLGQDMIPTGTLFLCRSTGLLHWCDPAVCHGELVDSSGVKICKISGFSKGGVLVHPKESKHWAVNVAETNRRYNAPDQPGEEEPEELGEEGPGDASEGEGGDLAVLLPLDHDGGPHHLGLEESGHPPEPPDLWVVRSHLRIHRSHGQLHAEGRAKITQLTLPPPTQFHGPGSSTHGGLEGGPGKVDRSKLLLLKDMDWILETQGRAQPHLAGLGCMQPSIQTAPSKKPVPKKDASPPPGIPSLSLLLQLAREVVASGCHPKGPELLARLLGEQRTLHAKARPILGLPPPGAQLGAALLLTSRPELVERCMEQGRAIWAMSLFFSFLCISRLDPLFLNSPTKVMQELLGIIAASQGDGRKVPSFQALACLAPQHLLQPGSFQLLDAIGRPSIKGLENKKTLLNRLARIGLDHTAPSTPQELVANYPGQKF